MAMAGKALLRVAQIWQEIPTTYATLEQYIKIVSIMKGSKEVQYINVKKNPKKNGFDWIEVGDGICVTSFNRFAGDDQTFTLVDDKRQIYKPKSKVA